MDRKIFNALCAEIEDFQFKSGGIWGEISSEYLKGSVFINL